MKLQRLKEDGEEAASNAGTVEEARHVFSNQYQNFYFLVLDYDVGHCLIGLWGRPPHRCFIQRLALHLPNANWKRLVISPSQEGWKDNFYLETSYFHVTRLVSLLIWHIVNMAVSTTLKLYLNFLITMLNLVVFEKRLFVQHWLPVFQFK